MRNCKHLVIGKVNQLPRTDVVRILLGFVSFSVDTNASSEEDMTSTKLTESMPRILTLGMLGHVLGGPTDHTVKPFCRLSLLGTHYGLKGGLKDCSLTLSH